MWSDSHNLSTRQVTWWVGTGQPVTHEYQKRKQSKAQASKSESQHSPLTPATSIANLAYP